MTYDAAVVLSHKLKKDRSLDAQTKERIELGIRYYHIGLVSSLLMSGDHKNLGEAYGVSLARVMEDYAIQNGVPMDKILREELSLETVGQLIFCRRGVIEPRGWGDVLLITHDYHEPRVKEIAELVMGDHITVHTVGVPYTLRDKDSVIESERAKTEVFRKTFSGVAPGDIDALIERLFSEHPVYAGKLIDFGERLSALIRDNTAV